MEHLEQARLVDGLQPELVGSQRGLHLGADDAEADFPWLSWVAMLVAAGGWPGLGLLVATVAGGAMVSGSVALRASYAFHSA